MSTFSGMRSIRRSFRRGVQRLLRRDGTPKLSLDDLKYAAGRALSLDDLLVRIPSQICDAFSLRLFVIYLRHGSTYVLQRSGDGSVLPGEDAVSLRSSSSVIVQLKRERRLLQLQTRGVADGWMLLADPADLRQFDDLRAEALLPLPGRTGLVGFAAVAGNSPTALRQHTRQLEQLASEIGIGLETALFQRTLQDEATQRERVTRSLELAREVQERMLPQGLPANPALDAAAEYISAEQVSGDYYDAFATPSGRFCYVIADVSGKGTAAALLMATLRSAMRTAMLTEPPLPELLRVVNGLLYEASSSSRYATLAVLVSDPETGTLVSSNAGHNPPVLWRNGECRRLTCGGPVLGLLPGAEFEHEVVTLAPGDRILLYTDGVTEWANEAGDEWGDEGLIAACDEVHVANAGTLVRHILGRVKAFAGRAPQVDDVTLMVLVAKGSPAPRT